MPFLPVPANTDSPAMRQALTWCRENHIPIRRCSDKHLKYRALNYWPDRGTITLDSGYKHPHGGFDAFVQTVLTMRAQEQHAAQR
ncbi:hypothetical protein ACO2Q3_19865 [Caulobacter sp. KR2-114]|uniref:hypothetical protein n=1 Tax=Caulobacter sp. KR2-114 TaxID=3400912 RepID=UPI003C079977